MPIKGGLVQDKTVAGGIALLSAGPLLTNSGGESCLVNLVSRTGQAPAGRDIIPLVVRGIVRSNDRRRASRLRYWEQPRRRQTANRRPQGGS